VREFKVGDRVMLEGVILPIDTHTNGYGVRMRGDATAWNAITQEAMARAKILRHDEITVPGIYLAKTEVGDEVIPLTIRADQINLGTVFMGFAYQGPIEWEGES